MSDDMVERVAREMCRERHPCWSIVSEIFETDYDRQATEFRDYARAAIAIALEEAARVAEIYEYDELEDDGGATIKPSAAIRAMITPGSGF
jgi:hypothetical protein